MSYDNYESIQELRIADQDPSKTGRNPILGNKMKDHIDCLFDTDCMLEDAIGLTSALVRAGSVLNQIEPIVAHNRVCTTKYKYNPKYNRIFEV